MGFLDGLGRFVGGIVSGVGHELGAVANAIGQGVRGIGEAEGGLISRMMGKEPSAVSEILAIEALVNVSIACSVIEAAIIKAKQDAAAGKLSQQRLDSLKITYHHYLSANPGAQQQIYRYFVMQRALQHPAKNTSPQVKAVEHSTNLAIVQMSRPRK